MGMTFRSAQELVAGGSSWPDVLTLLSSSSLSVSIEPADLAVRNRALEDLQVTTHSLLGAIAWNCGVISIDHGWVRVLGAGFGSLAGVRPEALHDPAATRTFQGVVVAYDILGGRFAIHGEGLDDVQPGEIVYWGPDSLTWMPLQFGHSALIEFVLSDRLEAFYADLRWDGWQDASSLVPLDEGLSAYPFPWSKEGKGANVSRHPVPMAELVATAELAAAQLRGLPDGTSVKIDWTD